jgi:ABC-type sugar transport system ATPase subunit
MRLKLTAISKSFAGVKALQQVDFDLLPGEVHALCGENGAGKSTLMNILTGNLQPDSGTIVLNGHKVFIPGPDEAASLGIAIVYQHLSLIDNLSVAENIFANQHPRTRWGLIDYPQLSQRTQRLLDQLNIGDISPRTLVGRLSTGQKQLVEIAKALSKEPAILILDEPTASISAREADTLFKIIRQLREEGTSIIYISHRLTEVLALADRVTVLKDGVGQGTFAGHTVSRASLIRSMVGRDLAEAVPSTASPGEVLLEVERLSGAGFQDISFQIRRGEIVGLAGLVGAGRSELAHAILGYRPASSGVVRKSGQAITLRHPADGIRAGIGYVPEERKTQGIFADMSVAENIVAANLTAAWQPGRGFSAARMNTLARQYREQLRISAAGTDQPIRQLSGGNQQKAILARWLLVNPDLLIADEPTHGVDVGAKAEIYDLLRQYARNGKAVLLISSELPEILALSDRILVLRQGELTAELPAVDATEEQIMALAM